MKKLTPETICGTARRSGKFKLIVCAKALYSYIDQRLLNLDLQLKPKRKLDVRHDCQNKKLFGLSIEDRPDVVNNREEFGHWEIDMAVGKRESAPVLLTLDERTTRHRYIIKIPSRSAEAVKQDVQQLRRNYDRFLQYLPFYYQR